MSLLPKRSEDTRHVDHPAVAVRPPPPTARVASDSLPAINRNHCSRSIGFGARVAPECADGPGTPHQDRADIVTVGGSLSWGHGLANRFTFTSALARNLGARASNLSVSGFGGVQSVLRLRRNLDLRPRLVLYAMWEDHLRRNLRRCMTVSFPGCLQVPAVRYVHDSRPDILFPRDLPDNFDLMRRWYLEASGGPETTFWTDIYWTAYDIFHRATVFLANRR